MFGKDRERFVKLLKMTHSSSDGEALVAIRKCNDMLVQHKLSWNDVVSERCSSQARSMPDNAANNSRGVTRNVRAATSQAFEASIRREKYFEQVQRNEKAAAIQVYVSKVPLLLRLMFFPLWAAAAMLAGVVIPEVSAPVRGIKLFAAILFIGICGAVWLQIFDVVVQLL